MSGKEKDPLRDILDKLETPAVRWALVCIGVLILVRLRLILFAAALPVMAYWHYSNHSEEPAERSAADGDEPPARGREANRDDDDDDDAFGNSGFGGGDKNDDKEVYDKSFWSSDGPETSAPRSAPSREPAPRPNDDDDDDFGFSAPAKETKAWGDDDAGGDDFPEPKAAGRSNMDDILGSLGSLGPSLGGGDDDFGLGKMSNDFDFLGGGGGFGDDDFLSGAMGGGFGRGGGKGKGKGKKGDREGGKGDKGDKGPREPNPKQLFVAGIGDASEDDIRMFFEREGEVDRLKILTDPDTGQPKGVCFVTFRTEEQAQQALSLHGESLNGRNITVRLAHGGNKGEKGDKGDKGGGKGKRDFDREPRMDFGGPSERFGSAFGDRGDGGERNSFDRPRGEKGKGKGKRMERGEMDDLLEDALADVEGPVKVGDFDAAARRFLTELRNQDRANDGSRFQEALDMVLKYTSQKDRGSVRKWPAYIFTLLTKFDSDLAAELREKDAERRSAKGGGKNRDIERRRDDDDRD